MFVIKRMNDSDYQRENQPEQVCVRTIFPQKAVRSGPRFAISQFPLLFLTVNLLRLLGRFFV